MCYLVNKIRLWFNIVYYTITKPKEESPLETGKPFGCACEHKNTTEKIFKYPLSGIEETFVRCDDCDFTVFAGWRPYDPDKEE